MKMNEGKVVRKFEDGHRVLKIDSHEAADVWKEQVGFPVFFDSAQKTKQFIYVNEDNDVQAVVEAGEHVASDFANLGKDGLDWIASNVNGEQLTNVRVNERLTNLFEKDKAHLKEYKNTRKMKVSELKKLIETTLLFEARKKKPKEKSSTSPDASKWAYSNTMGWGVADKEHIDTTQNQWHAEHHVFKKFMKDMFNLDENVEVESHQEPDGDEGDETEQEQSVVVKIDK